MTAARTAGVALTALVVAARMEAASAVALRDVETEPGSGIAIRFHCPFREPPLEGHAPIVVEIRNDGPAKGAWDLTFVSTTYQKNRESRYRLEADPGSSRRFELAVPLLNDTPNYNSVNVAVRGPGVVNATSLLLYQRHLTGGGGHGRTAPCVAMSESLAIRSWGEIASALENQHSTLPCGSQFDPADLPEDWRSYTGFAQLFMTEAEWRGVNPGAAKAIQDWVALGGGLYLAEEPEKAAGRRRGFGWISPIAMSGGKVDIEAVVKRILAIEDASEDYTAWRDVHVPARPQLPVWPLSTVILAFAAVVGPLNLFLFCRGTKRYRVYWTTPVLSLAAAGVLVAFILNTDGTGGTGRRVVTRMLVPSESQEVVVQEQAARTGLLLNPTFALGEPSMMRLAAAGDALLGSMLLGTEGTTQYGAWFESRSVQVHVLETVRPTRARVERVDDGTGSPELLSSLPGVLAEVMYVDAAGAYWRGRAMAQGVRTTLSRIDEEEWTMWWRQRIIQAGPLVSRRLRPGPPPRGKTGSFVALARGLPGAIDTHPGIQWAEDETMVLGPVL